MAQPTLDQPSSRSPTALDRAAAAIAADPKRSLREIAAVIGVSHQTVARAAQRMKAAGDVTGSEVTVPPPRDRMAWVLQVLASDSKASPAQKAKIARAMAAHFNRRRRP